VVIQTLTNRLFADNDLKADALRLDLLHPEVSGNKSFKLKYHLEEAISDGNTGMVSFGGAYSNHLVAMAFICRERGMKSTAIIRGEELLLNPSIHQMRNLGMELIFVSRELYRDKQKLIQDYLSHHPEYYYVPEGGQSEQGIRGASEIMQPEFNKYTHVVCAAGTGTTIAGIVQSASSQQQIIGICCLKVSDTNENGLLNFIRSTTSKNNYRILFDYHFGGYARKSEELIRFMNQLYRDENIPTDFVYTGKLFYAVHDLARKKSFAPGSRLLIIHSGGLQGNRSLPQGVLDF
jgi:1-aminocyclopropane-1-carboxylate deaminase